MALVGIQALSYRNSSVAFLCFSKGKFLEFQCYLEQDNSSSNLLISYLLITQTQIEHMLPTSFKFRVNLYIKSVVSKTWENSRMKTRYLKGITTKQLFIISNARDYSQSPFIQLLKIKVKENLTHLLFCFQNLRSHPNIYITS